MREIRLEKVVLNIGIGDTESNSQNAKTLLEKLTGHKAAFTISKHRQRALIRRANGLRVKFEDNAGIMINDENLPIGTEVKGAMAREVVERFVKVAGIASKIV